MPIDENGFDSLLAPTALEIEEIIERSRLDEEIDEISTNVGELARFLLTAALSHAQYSGLRWWPPHVSSEGEGDLVLRWMGRAGVSLSVHIGRRGRVEYLKAWGPNILRDMEDGEISLGEVGPLLASLDK